MKIIIIFLLFLSLNTLDEIEYKIVHRIIGKVLDKFSVKFNKITGIKANMKKWRTILILKIYQKEKKYII